MWINFYFISNVTTLFQFKIYFNLFQFINGLKIQYWSRDFYSNIFASRINLPFAINWQLSDGV